MPETFYPSRQRCKKCGKSFSASGALLGLYCSTSCAGREKAAVKLEDAPRGCKTDRGSGGVNWYWKRKYSSEKEISKTIREDPSSKWYWCEESRGCLKLHIGHSRVKIETETTRSVYDLSQIADTLIKTRETRKLTQRAAAKAMAIPWVRLKEIEAGDKNSSIEALFIAFRFYGIKLALILK